MSWAQQLVEALPNKRPILVAVTGYGQAIGSRSDAD